MLGATWEKMSTLMLTSEMLIGKGNAWEDVCPRGSSDILSDRRAYDCLHDAVSFRVYRHYYILKNNRE